MVQYTPFDSIHAEGEPECIKGCKTEYSDGSVMLDAASMQASSAVYYPSGPKFKCNTPTGSNTIGAMVPAQTWTRHAWGFTSDRTLSGNQMAEVEKQVSRFFSTSATTSFNIKTKTMRDGSILADVFDVSNLGLPPISVALSSAPATVTPTVVPQQSKYTYTHNPGSPAWPHLYRRANRELYCDIKLPEHALDEIMNWIWNNLPAARPTWQGYTVFHVVADGFSQSCKIGPVGNGGPPQVVLFSKPTQNAPTQPSSVP